MPESIIEKKKYYTKSASAYAVKEFYTPEDLAKSNNQYVKDLGDPGKFPYTRGVRPDLYRRRPWSIEIYSGYGIPQDSNLRYKRLLELGAEGIYMAVHLPTQVGIDSDHELSKGEVGRCGIAVDSLRDIETAFQDIDITKLHCIGMLGNSIGPVALAFFIALAEKRGFHPNQLKITLQNDVIKEYATRGTHIFPINPAVRLAADVVEYCAEKKLTNIRPMYICGAHMRSAGTSWELAFAMCDMMAYVDHILAGGLKIDDFAHFLRLFTSVASGSIDMFEEVAKARAVRRIWAKVMKERYGAEKTESMAVDLMAFIIAGATAQQPINNIARIALGAHVAIMAGVDALHTACWDEALTLPSDEAIQTAIRTQQILRYETGSEVAVTDPLGGSYFLEDLTDRIETEVWKNIQTIENMGGALEAVSKGFYSQQIQAGSYKIQTEVWNGTRGIVGVNLFRKEGEKNPIGTFKIGDATEKKKIAGLKALRKERNNVKLKEALKRVREAAEGGENLVEPCLAAVREYGTIGEVCDELRAVFGEYTEGLVYI
jgi:methylmalonyl-CoA mutase N-terminal domain/subunit